MFNWVLNTPSIINFKQMIFIPNFRDKNENFDMKIFDPFQNILKECLRLIQDLVTKPIQNEKRIRMTHFPVGKYLFRVYNEGKKTSMDFTLFWLLLTLSIY